MSKTPVLIIKDPKTSEAFTIQLKHVAEVRMDVKDKSVYLVPFYPGVNPLLMGVEGYTYKYATDGQVENVHNAISMAMAKGCSVKIAQSGDAMQTGKGS